MECTVELLNTNKSVVIALRGYEEHASDSYDEIANRIINCVMDAKKEFCHFIQPDFFLLDPTDESDYLSEDNLFSLRRVERFLKSPKVKEIIKSDNGKKIMSTKKLVFMHKRNYWYNLFPIDFFSFFQKLKEVGTKWHDLGLHLKLPCYKLDIIEEENPRNVERCLKKMISAWIDSSPDPPCWWHLAEALREIGLKRLADEIERSYGQL